MPIQNIKTYKNQKGYIALIAILIIIAVTLAVGLSMGLLGIGETQAGLTGEQSRQSFQLANGCLEEAILRIKKDNNYEGGNLNIKEGSCNITVGRGPKQGNPFTINIQANVNNYIRKIEAQIDTQKEPVKLIYWKEI